MVTFADLDQSQVCPVGFQCLHQNIDFLMNAQGSNRKSKVLFVSQADKALESGTSEGLSSEYEKP